MVLNGKRKWILISVTILGVLFIGVFGSALTGRFIWGDNSSEKTSKYMNESLLISKINKSIEKLNDTYSKLFKCRKEVLNLNGSLRKTKTRLSEKSQLLSSRTEELNSTEEDLSSCKGDLKKHRSLLNVSYQITKELENQSICKNVKKEPESIRRCLLNLKNREEYWNIMKHLKDLSEVYSE